MMHNHVIKNILEFSSSEQSKYLITKITKINLPSEIKNFMKEYRRIGFKRDEFLWKWSYSLMSSKNPRFAFSSVPKNMIDTLAKVKTIIIMFISILDDISDKNKNRLVLDRLTAIPFAGYNHVSKAGLFLNKLWRYIYSEVSKLERFDEFKDLFMFDTRSMMNCFYYSALLNKHPEIINLLENRIHNGYNMGVFLYFDIDLMASPDFDKNELPFVREIVWYAQQMTRIGNWLSTWKRELKEKDFSSGIFAYAVDNEMIKPEDLIKIKLKNAQNNNIIKILDTDKIFYFFMNEWLEYHKKIEILGKKINTIDINELLKGLEMTMKYHLSSTGLK